MLLRCPFSSAPLITSLPMDYYAFMSTVLHFGKINRENPYRKFETFRKEMPASLFRARNWSVILAQHPGKKDRTTVIIVPATICLPAVGSDDH
jgi:hypothetical protein